MVSPGNRHCASYIGALSFPIPDHNSESMNKISPYAQSYCKNSFALALMYSQF